MFPTSVGMEVKFLLHDANFVIPPQYISCLGFLLLFSFANYGICFYVSIVFNLCAHGNTGWTTGRSGFDPRRGQSIFSIASVSRPAPGPTQPPVQWVPGVLSPGVKARPGRDTDHSPPSSAKVENE
jgi:hypothetical protein